MLAAGGLISYGQSITSLEVSTEVELSDSERYIIASNSTGNHIDVEVRVDWPKFLPPDTVYTLEFDLLDESDQSVASVSFSPTVPLSTTYTAALFPTIRLDPFEGYRVRSRLLSEPSGGGIVIPVVESTVTEESGATYYHFDSTTSADDALNTYVVLESAGFSKTHLVEGMVSGDFAELSVNAQVFRYDTFDVVLPGSDSIEFLFNVRLFESGTDLEVALDSNDLALSAGIASYKWVDGVKVPEVAEETFVLKIDPAVQLDPVNKAYYVVVSASHYDDPVATPPTDLRLANSLSTLESAVRLLHFNGNLAFGAYDTVFTEISNSPSFFGAGLPADTISTQLTVETGFLKDFPSFTFGASTVLSPVYLDASGNASYGGASLVSLKVPADDSAQLANVSFRRVSPALLSTSELTSDLEVRLPPGLGWSAQQNDMVLESKVEISGVVLGTDLNPTAADLSASFNGNSEAWIVEETKPVRVNVDSISWKTATGTFDFNSKGVAYVRAPQQAQLDHFHPSLDNSDGGLKRSNDGYYEGVALAEVTAVKAEASGLNGSAEMSLSLAAEAVEFVTHFPYDVSIDAVGLGQVDIASDRVNPSTSSLEGITTIQVSYNQGCLDDGTTPLCPPPQNLETITFEPAEKSLVITPDGGLHAEGTIGFMKPLSWGLIDKTHSTYVHSIDQLFSTGNFLVSGHFLNGEDNPLGDDQGPGVVLLSGFRPDELATAERPSMASYESSSDVIPSGLADYSGLNFRCASDSAFSVSMNIAGELFQTIPLKGISKYYARHSGVSGIHDPIDGGFPSEAVIWGYAFNFTNFGLAYLSNENVTSLTDGNVDIPEPSNFIQEFEELIITCLGKLDKAKVPDDDPEKELDYWDANFLTQDIQFTNNPAECDPGVGETLVLGIRTYASHLTYPMIAPVGIRNTGQIARAFEMPGTDFTSRFKMPARFEITGPNGENPYLVSPFEDAYFNHAASDSRPINDQRGYWNLYGSVDVQYFKDLQVHFHVSATEADTSSPVYAMGGWPVADKGWKPEGQTPAADPFFDESHHGYPTTNQPVAVSLAEYRRDGATLEDDELYRVRAQQTFLGVVDFDYPLDWSFVLRRFRSSELVGDNLLVVAVEHQIEFLSAENVKIAFGAEYGNFSENLESLIFDAIDDGLGVSQAITNALGNEIFGGISDGLSGARDLLDADPRNLLGPAFGSMIDARVEQLVLTLDALPQGSYKQQAVNDAISQLETDLSNHIQQGVNSILVDDVITEIDDALGLIQDSLNLILYGLGSSDGLLTQNAVTNELLKFKETIDQYVGIFLPDFSDDLLLYIDPLLGETTPTIQQIVTVLEDVNAIIGTVRSVLNNPGGAMYDEMQAIISGSESALKNEISAALSALSNELSDGTDDLYSYWNFKGRSPSEWEDRIIQEIEDELYQSDFASLVQESIRQQVFDPEALMRESMDTAFSAMRELIEDVIKKAVPLDEAFTAMLDKVSNWAGSANIVGFAHIKSDSLHELRLDGNFKFKVPEDIEIDAYLRILDLDSAGVEGCSPPAGVSATEVSIGASAGAASWSGVDSAGGMSVSAGIKCVFEDDSGIKLRGFGGHFDITGDSNYEGVDLEYFAATIQLGVDQSYLAGGFSGDFEAGKIAGGAFFGTSCNSDPLLIADPQFGEVLGPADQFSGGYLYFEVWAPLYDFSCVFRLKAGIGLGLGYFVEGPTYVGKLKLGAEGEALCVVTIRGEAVLIGVKRGDEFTFRGKGTLSGKIAFFKFKETVNFKFAESEGWTK
ncbi:MAG: hypothetical protein AAF212_09320 [Verrucomicrobiota bacterium]